MQRVGAARLLARSGTVSRSAACVHYDATSSDVEALFHQNLDKDSRRSDGNSQVLTTHKDAIHLYRDIWRYSRLFVWSDETGRPWRVVLRQSARQEFEAARHETDPTVILRLLLTGRDAVMQAKDKFMEKRQDIENQELHRPEHRG